MLNFDPSTRISAKAALKHPWFKETQSKNKEEDHHYLDADVISRLKNYKGMSRLKKAAMNVLVKTMDSKEFEHLRKQFYSIDRDKTGFISAEELTRCMKKVNMNIPDEQIKEIISEVDFR